MAKNKGEKNASVKNPNHTPRINTRSKTRTRSTTLVGFTDTRGSNPHSTVAATVARRRAAAKRAAEEPSTTTVVEPTEATTTPTDKAAERAERDRRRQALITSRTAHAKRAAGTAGYKALLPGTVAYRVATAMLEVFPTVSCPPGTYRLDQAYTKACNKLRDVDHDSSAARKGFYVVRKAIKDTARAVVESAV